MKKAFLLTLICSAFFVSCFDKKSEQAGPADTKNDVEKIKLEGNSASDLLFKLQADKRTQTIKSNDNMVHVKLGPMECLRMGSHGGADLAITTTCLITP